MLDQQPQSDLTQLVANLNDALVAQDADAAAALFLDSGYWRDLAAFTWNLKTMEGPAQVRDMASAQLSHIKPVSIALDPKENVTSADGVADP